MLPVLTAGIVALLAVAVAGAASFSQGQTRKMTLYSVATAEQFVNNADDRTRGSGNNPFGNYNDQPAVVKEKGNGPYPGDETLFFFALYTSKDLKAKAGTASFTCRYNFGQNAFCTVSYQLKGGTVIGAGEFNFNARSFTLAITGGYGKYVNAKGQILETPSVNHAQRLAFEIDTV